MNLGNPQIQQAIIDIAETSESNEVAEACRLVIADYLEQGDTEISGAREVILTAIECVERTKQMVSEKLQQAIDRIRRYKSGERAEDVWQKPSGTLGSRADYLEDACFVADYVVFLKGNGMNSYELISPKTGEYRERRAKQLDEAELVEWDGSMIFSEEVSGYRDGWFDSPDDLADYLADEDEDLNKPEFAFVGRKCVRELDLSRAIEQMTEDTYDDAEVCATLEDLSRLEEAVTVFNAKYAVTYYEHDYKRKVRIFAEVVAADEAESK